MPKKQPKISIPGLLKAIRANCLDCSGYSHSEVDTCLSVDCQLYLYRLGRGLTIEESNEYYEQLELYKEKIANFQLRKEEAGEEE